MRHRPEPDQTSDLRVAALHQQSHQERCFHSGVVTTLTMLHTLYNDYINYVTPHTLKLG